MRTSFQSEQAKPPADTMVSVSVVRPLEIGLADWMSRLRDWLDQQGIEPAAFKYHDEVWGNQTYEVTFHDKTQADRFAAEFNKKTFDNNRSRTVGA